MSKLEKKIMASEFAEFIIVYKRYVDDICLIWGGNEQELAAFLNFINTLHYNINFNLEREVNQCLPFLDLLLCRKEDHISLEVYRKPTATDNVIQFDSLSPGQHKFAAFNSLFYRLFKLPLSNAAFEKEYNIIKSIAINNKFPISSFNKLYYKFYNKYKLSYCVVQGESETKKNFRCMTYFGGISQQLAKFFKPYNISVAFKTPNSLKRNLVRPLDKQDPLAKSGVPI